MNVSERYAAVVKRVADAAARAGRDAGEITIVVVAKTFPIDAIERALEAGATDIGENRAQELRDKARMLANRVRWHFVGPLQTNKVRYVVGTAHLIHAVDRFGLAEAIGRRARAVGTDQQVLLEVNISGEASKHGIEPTAAVALAERVSAIDGVSVAGLMTIPPLPRTSEDSRPYYRHLTSLRERVARVAPTAKELSMGMTRDFEVAIEEGATLVRVGEAIFGPRKSA